MKQRKESSEGFSSKAELSVPDAISLRQETAKRYERSSHVLLLPSLATTNSVHVNHCHHARKSTAVNTVPCEGVVSILSTLSPGTEN